MDVTKQDRVEATDDSESCHVKYVVLKAPVSLKDVPSRTDASLRQTCLGDALYEEQLLYRVLGHLLDDGLHECRRVCRKWRDVCSLLPVKLVDVRKTTFRDAARVFPNATSVSVTRDRGWSADAFSECLSSFTCLKHLRLQRINLEEDHRDPDRLDTGSLPARVPFLSQLESLTLNPIHRYAESWISMMGTYLTNLTHLEIGGNCSGGGWNVDPLSETHKLKSLTIRKLQLFNNKGKLIFPPSSNLTRLDIRSDFDYRGNPLRVLKPYASTMKSLTSSGCVMMHHHMFQLPVDWTVLSECVCLESLCLPDLGQITDGLLIELERTSNLTELDIGSSQLKSLKLVDLRERALRHSCDAAERASGLSNAISHLTGLTKLVTYFPVKAPLLGRLTRLVSLGIYVDEDDADSLEHSLAKLELLEELELAFIPRIRSGCLSKLPRLKSLSLTSHNQLDDELVSALVRLSQLTSLKVHYRRKWPLPLSYFSQFSQLSNLRQLDIAFVPDFLSDPCDVFPEGSFPRLRVLRIQRSDFSDDMRRRIMERFPCLITLKTGYLSEEKAEL